MNKFPEFVVIGLIERAHGVRGEVKVKPITDFPSRFENLQTVFLEFPTGKAEKLHVSKACLRQESVYLKLTGINDREAAQRLKGLYLKVPSCEVVTLAPDEFYHFEIIGFEVRATTGEVIGEVAEVMSLPANDVLVVKNDQAEHLVPLIKDVVKEIDRSKHEITIEIIDGLLEL